MSFPLALLEGEKVLREEKAIYIRNNPIGLGYNVIHGTLWLTSQRLVHQSALGSLIQYPLSHVTEAARAEVSIGQRAGASFSAALRVDFDTSGREYFIPDDIDAWATALLEAKTNAPSLAYIQTPPGKSALEEGGRDFKFIIGIFAAVVLCFMCSVSGFMLFIFFLAGPR